MSRGYVLAERAMQARGGMALQFHSFLLLNLGNKEWSNSLPGRFTASDKAADILWIWC